jgi:hypothetical protein
MTPTYRVSFFKKVCDSAGHQFDVLRGAVEVRAESSGSAVQAARREFAKLKNVGQWTMRADREQTTVLPGRKRAQRGVAVQGT